LTDETEDVTDADSCRQCYTRFLKSLLWRFWPDLGDALNKLRRRDMPRFKRFKFDEIWWPVVAAMSVGRRASVTEAYCEKLKKVLWCKLWKKMARDLLRIRGRCEHQSCSPKWWLCNGVESSCWSGVKRRRDSSEVATVNRHKKNNFSRFRFFVSPQISPTFDDAEM
jgi:hypothetical protein